MISKLLVILGCIPVMGLMPAFPASEEEPLFSFGVIADIQYGDKETKGSRHYREALPRLEECVDELNRHELAFTIQLGDIIDGNKTPEQTLTELQRVLRIYNRLTMPKYHVIGNHCLEAGAGTLRENLPLDSFYYDFTAPSADGWRFVVLDGNAAGYGKLGEVQLEWFKSILIQAQENREKVVVFNHFALLKEAADKHRMKTPKSVQEVMEASSCVVAYFAGHDHRGGYVSRNGIHHVTVKAMVGAPVHNAYAIIEVYPDRLEERGYGKEPSRTLSLSRSGSVR